MDYALKYNPFQGFLILMMMYLNPTTGRSQGEPEVQSVDVFADAKGACLWQDVSLNRIW